MEKRLVRLCKFLNISRLCNLQSTLSQTVIPATNYEESIASLWTDVRYICSWETWLFLRRAFVLNRAARLFYAFLFPLYSSI